MIALALAGAVSGIAAGVLAAVASQVRLVRGEMDRLQEGVSRARTAQRALVPVPSRLQSISERAVGSASRFWEWPQQ